jgi:predicted ribosomally synthesized peptide with SipW-like signal peptide
MKKWLIVIGALVIIAALVGIGAFGWFSDTETSNNNTFTAGSLDLKVDNKDDPQVVHITRTNLVPGAAWTTQYGGQWVLKNAGTVGGTVTFTIKNLADYENGCLEPEIEAGDVTCGTSPDQGELGQGLINRVYWSLNQPPWGSLDPSYTSLALAENQPITGTLFHLAPGESKNAYLYLTWDTSMNDNLGQGDSVEFDVEFYLEQDH